MLVTLCVPVPGDGWWFRAGLQMRGRGCNRGPERLEGSVEAGCGICVRLIVPVAAARRATWWPRLMPVLLADWANSCPAEETAALPRTQPRTEGATAVTEPGEMMEILINISAVGDDNIRMIISRTKQRWTRLQLRTVKNELWSLAHSLPPFHLPSSNFVLIHLIISSIILPPPSHLPTLCDCLFIYPFTPVSLSPLPPQHTPAHLTLLACHLSTLPSSFSLCRFLFFRTVISQQGGSRFVPGRFVSTVQKYAGLRPLDALSLGSQIARPWSRAGCQLPRTISLSFIQFEGVCVLADASFQSFLSCSERLCLIYSEKRSWWKTTERLLYEMKDKTMNEKHTSLVCLSNVNPLKYIQLTKIWNDIAQIL